MGLREPSHWIILIVVLVIVFGATRLPTIAKGIGQSMKIFKREVRDLRDDDSPTPPQAPTTPPAATGSTSTPPAQAPAQPTAPPTPPAGEDAAAPGTTTGQQQGSGPSPS